MEFDVVVRNGRVVTACDITDADIGIRDGTIVALGTGLASGRRDIDAAGHLVLPGGIDSHAHIEERGDGSSVNPDSFASASASAAAGGTTTVICFVHQRRGTSLAAVAADYAQQARRSRIDYAFHLMVTDPRPDILEKELPALISAGNRSLKVFMANDGLRLTDGDVLRVLAVARRFGAIVCIHAEHHDIVEFYKAALLSAGLTAPKYHIWSRPMLVERECTHRAIALAEALDVPIQIFHVTGQESADEIARARARGLAVWGETCPQYFVFTEDDLDRPGFEGAKLVCSPVFRTKSDQEALWNALRNGTLSNVSSDHAPSNYDDIRGKKAQGEATPFTKIPNGLPGLAARMPLLFSEGVSKGNIDLTTFVAVTATNPAKIFGLWPRKGTLAVGSDADLAIWNEKQAVTLTNALMHHGADYTPYEGMTVRGWPVLTMQRGVVLCEDGLVVGAEGSGIFLPRPPYEAIRPRHVFPIPFNPVDAHAVPGR